MRRIGFIVLMLVSFLLPAIGSAHTLLPSELDHGDLLPPECLTNTLQGFEVFDSIVGDHTFGRRIFIWLDEGDGPPTGGNWQIPGFHSVAIDLRRCIDRRSFTSGVPEPLAAFAFGIGAVMVAAAIRRR